MLQPTPFVAHISCSLLRWSLRADAPPPKHYTSGLNVTVECLALLIRTDVTDSNISQRSHVLPDSFRGFS